MLPTAAVPYAALMTQLRVLKLELSKANKKALFQKLASLNPGEISKACLEVVPAVEVDVGRLVGDVMDRTERYLRSRNNWITAEESILGGTPVIRGTRITVYSLLGRVEHGETIEEILKDNPDLPRKAVEAAAIFAGAHPLRGRPSGRPWVRRA
ncbi:DUF433 domain-containing protein [Methylacidimicrobium tartarophylax]|uniref:DUF433 domain-containing protein n=1 Tax=Methylacidimicrobium tartarophylax TaxID=1041768 RepID=A0A5E6MJM8_9BACT|nr:DUF433 domain-containing protein [Methylacidimicrobium tartarophylax]VVM08165.1 hypothetical protein MAMT_02157 [Methylacidimicrobium tartarophylax]